MRRLDRGGAGEGGAAEDAVILQLGKTVAPNWMS